MNILAIDQATKSGWCCGDDLYGLWNLSIMKDEDNAMRLIRFRSKLIEMIEINKIQLVCYERIAGQFKTALIFSAKLVAIIETVCHEKGISYTAFSAKEIKLFATGKGGASKDLMIKFAKEKHGYAGDDDNVADAIWIYQLAKSRFK